MKIIECPRDAMQGLPNYIPVRVKVRYLNALLRAGFDTIDFGSFVSPKAVPQMRDTAEVIDQLETEDSKTSLLAIVANLRGADDAVKFEQIDYIGYPFSVSETFQKRNANRSIRESVKDVDTIQNLCIKHKKQLVVYLSMAFGNPYGDQWNPDIVKGWAERLNTLEVQILSLSDTVGSADPQDITDLFTTLISGLPDTEIGAHFHVRPDNWRDKTEAAYNAGCRRFDSAMQGYGGCPMAKDELTGNLATENLVKFLEEKEEVHNLDIDKLKKLSGEALKVYSGV